MVQIFHFDPDILRLFAVFVIGFLGLALVLPKLSAYIEILVSRLSSKLGNGSSNQRTGFIGGYITGFSLGIVWAPCAGPILATIATLAATKAVNLEVIMVTLFYVAGIGIPLFFFSYAGSLLFTKSRALSPYIGRIQQLFGILMIATALAIYTNYDKVLEANLLNAIPSYSQFLLKLETNQAVTKGLDILKGHKNIDESKVNMPFPKAGALPKLSRAPEFTGITKWLNLPNSQTALTLGELKGKVVLIDFWTYTCINCIRTLPHVTGWYEKYKNQGFIVISVHSPEFEFEKKTENVAAAIKQYGIRYPVAQDNDYGTWKAYANNYWPAEYLIDKAGYIRHTHFGEGEYDQTEKAIQSLLEEAGNQVAPTLENMPDETPKTSISPETYIGSTRMSYLYPNGTVGNGKQNFTLSSNLPQNQFSLGGDWTIDNEYSIAGKNAALEYNFTADKVFLVMRPPANSISRLKVFIDGKVVDSSNAGVDVKEGIITVDSDRLYTLIDLKGKTENHLLRLEFDSVISVYAFTFG